MIAEYDQPAVGGTLALKRSYAWGLDLLGSFRASGGVGALLQLRDYSENATYLAAYDGNGNLTTLQNAATSTLAATYEYGPFGEPIATSGAYADKNPVRFSTKYTDDETGLVYYGRRYYDPKNGRFFGRDPIEEQGGMNLYGFVLNNPVNRWDYLGMYAVLNRTENNYELTIPLYFAPGTSQEIIDGAVIAIEGALKGKFGDITLIAKVKLMPAPPTSKDPGNSVNILSGNAKSISNYKDDPRSQNGIFSIYRHQAIDLVWAHEAAHAVGLPDKYQRQWLNFMTSEYEWKDLDFIPEDKRDYEKTIVTRPLPGWEGTLLGGGGNAENITEKDFALFISTLGDNRNVWILTPEGPRRASDVPKDRQAIIDMNLRIDDLKRGVGAFVTTPSPYSELPIDQL